MLPSYFTLTNGQSKIIPVDIYTAPPFQVALEAEVVTAATFGVEVTKDNIFDPTVTPSWSNTDVAGLNPGASATARGTQTTPVRAFRFSMTAGAGSLKCKLWQQGLIG